MNTHTKVVSFWLGFSFCVYLESRKKTCAISISDEKKNQQQQYTNRNCFVYGELNWIWNVIKQKCKCIFQFVDLSRFYIASDFELMIDILKGEINFLKSAWQNLLGRPLVTLVLKAVHLGRWLSMYSSLSIRVPHSPVYFD